MIEEHFPEFFRRADRHADSWQRRYLWSERIELMALLLAAGFSTVPAARLVIVLAFALAISAHLFRLVSRADEKWWNGRAGAESAKTLSWKFVVCGEPFGRDVVGVEGVLADRLTDIAKGVADLVPISVSQSHVTDEMQECRAQPLTVRISLYKKLRIEEQMRWYARNADNNAAGGRYWSWATIAAQTAALLLGIVGVANGWDLDVVGLFSALGAALVAWSAVKQFEVLARSYAVASNELSAIETKLSAAQWDERSWAAFVNDAEEAISREHTSWRASRAV